MSSRKYTQKAQQVREFFSKRAEELGRETGFVQRRSKVTGAIFGWGMTLACLETGEATLGKIVRVSQQLGVSISEAGWQQRISDTAVEFMASLLGKAIEGFAVGSELPVAALQRFTRIEVLDSSEVSLSAGLRAQFRGAKRQAALKLQVSYDYLHGVISRLQVTEARRPDQSCELHLERAERGSLHLFDLGYFKQELLAALDAQGAFFISRLQTQTAVYEQPDDLIRLDLPVVLAGLERARWEGQVYLGRKTRLPVRILAEQLPPAIADQRRRKAHQKAKRLGKAYSAHHLALLSWSLFITNVPADDLSFAQILGLYRLRWQIELLFKLCKSQARIASAGAWGRERFLCQLYARLLGVVLFHWLAAPLRLASHELSLPKAFALFQQSAGELRLAFSSVSPLSLFLAQLEGDFLRFALKSQRKKSPSSLQSFILLGLA
jgi:hypothetical protein